MIPFGNKTVTLVHRETSKDANGRSIITYVKYTLSGCSWKAVKAAAGTEGAFPQKPTVICRIPATQQKPEVGDVLILGKYSENISSSTDAAKILESDNAVKVASVGDNSLNGVLSHYACKG